MAHVIQAGEAYATSGERKAAEELAKLPASWFVITNKVLPTTNDRSFEIDFIVVGRQMVFVIDEKAWRGKIHGTDYHWVRSDGASQKSPLNKVDYVAKVVAGHLRNRTAGFDKLSGHTVAGCVLLTEASSRPSISDPRASKGVLLLDEVVEKLQQRDASEGDPGVEGLRDRIKDTFVNLAHRPNVPKQINGYTIVDKIDGPAGARLFTAEHIDGGARALTMYDVARDDPKRDFYLQEYKTLSQLTGKGVAPEVQDPFQWSEDFLVIPSQIPEGTTLAAVEPPTSEAEALDQTEIAAAAFNSLAVVHDQGMLHRALSPSVIHISHHDGKPRVAFSRFFAARTEQKTIAPHLDELLLDDPYAAPEIQVGYGYADEGSDTYSLAAVVLERLCGISIAQLSRDENGTIRIPAAEDGWRFFLNQSSTTFTLG